MSKNLILTDQIRWERWRLLWHTFCAGHIGIPVVLDLRLARHLNST
jgi:hypothetical protein